MRPTLPTIQRQRIARLVRKRMLWCSASMLLLVSVLAAGTTTLGQAGPLSARPTSTPTPGVSDPNASQLATDLAQASARYGVPVPLLAALCFFEGGMSMHDGQPSEDNGYGCMHLTQNVHTSTLAQAARDLGVSTTTLQRDMGANIAGGAALLRGMAGATTPRDLADWYGAVAVYSGATQKSAAQTYADALYTLLRQGFSVGLASGGTYVQQPIAVQPNTATLAPIQFSTALPSGCTNDGHVDYPGAIDCILNPATFDCNNIPSGTNCSYNGANRPYDLAINRVVIHDVEGTAQDALTWFQTPSSNASAHYIVGSDGTVYQVVHEKDISYQAGNWWYNEHSVGIEHAGVDASGYSWYNATEYLASAKLVAYLVKKYAIPVDHAHIVSHGTIPSPSLNTSPNHVDPGPYWLWDYYLGLVRAQGVSSPLPTDHANVVTLHPTTDQSPYGAKGTETSANFNFFNVYAGPTTKGPLVAYLGSSTDVTNETFNVESNMSYYYVAKEADPGGSGKELYEIWYGVSDQGNGNTYWADGKLAWLAVPRASADEGQCATTCLVVKLHGPSGGTANIYGRPSSSSSYIIGAAPAGSIFISEANVVEDADTAPPTPTPGTTHPSPPPRPTVPPGPPTATPSASPSATATTASAPHLGPLPTVPPGPMPTTTATPTTGPAPMPTFSPVPSTRGPIWYEIDFNHRQAWVPASEVTFI